MEQILSKITPEAWITIIVAYALGWMQVWGIFLGILFGLVYLKAHKEKIGEMFNGSNRTDK
jgi:hypothetical protein